MNNRANLLSYIDSCGVNEEDFNTYLALYSAPFVDSKIQFVRQLQALAVIEPPWEVVEGYYPQVTLAIDKKQLEEMGQDYDALKSAADAQVRFGYKTPLRAYIQEHHPDIATAMQAKLDFNKEVDLAYVECANTKAPTQLTMSGIEQAWAHNDLNQGHPDLMVTRVDQANPFDDSGRTGVINIRNLTEGQLRDKIDYAKNINPDSPSVLVVANGPHWAMLAIDPSSKKYRYVDSHHSSETSVSIPPNLKSYLATILPDYHDISDHKTLQRQQIDDTSCGHWVLMNTQTIADKGIDAHMYYEPLEQDRTAKINEFSYKTQKTLAVSSLQAMLDDSKAPAANVERVKLATGILNIQDVTKVASPSVTPKVSSKGPKSITI